ncbi:hypothetical protein DCS_08073 [Drechmeria coniospora]|uniref:Uncharacterized protein n=1 Tax=Drechmeria coniospora TaxID=98403 RepID=A0A151GG72_DRECN|nr:hypothetical protein DCS_08073 [Drechmeria coniospora]KYK56107.1 hypothetical protein DCS_08073 [Drechmeria coniospora]
MKFVSSIAALAVLAAAAPHDKNKAPQQSLDVKLSMVGNTKVEAILTNTGPKAVRLLKSGTILGNSPTKKATVSSGGPFVPQPTPCPALIYSHSFLLLLGIA